MCERKKKARMNKRIQMWKKKWNETKGEKNIKKSVWMKKTTKGRMNKERKVWVTERQKERKKETKKEHLNGKKKKKPWKELNN